MQSTEKVLWPKWDLDSFINSLCIINVLENINFFESIYKGFTFSLYMIM